MEIVERIAPDHLLVAPGTSDAYTAFSGEQTGSPFGQPRQPCLDLWRAGAAANALTLAFSAAESGGWRIAMAHDGRCWLGRVGGSWTSGASGYQGGTARESEAMVRVMPSGDNRAFQDILPTPVGGTGDRSPMALRLTAAFAQVPGMLVVEHAPDKGIVADRVVECYGSQVGGTRVMIVNLRKAGQPVAWPGGEPARIVRTDRDPYCERELLLGMSELCLDGYYPGKAERLLRGSWTAKVDDEGDALDVARLASIRARLAAMQSDRGAVASEGGDARHPIALWMAAAAKGNVVGIPSPVSPIT